MIFYILCFFQDIHICRIVQDILNVNNEIITLYVHGVGDENSTYIYIIVFVYRIKTWKLFE